MSLQALAAAGVFSSVDALPAAADCTWRVQWQGYVVGILYIVFYRNICGLWRKTPWPVCICVHPREDAAVYRHAIRAVRAELARRRLPRPRQLGLDHFPGLEDVFLAEGECEENR